MSFDVLAPHYRWMEFVLAGNKLQRCRTAFLGHVLDRRNVLLVGEGHGRFLLECRRQLQRAHITCVDSSAQMLTQARKRLQNCGLGLGRTAFIQADALAWTPPRQAFDLIVTHFFLDCFRRAQLERIIAALAQGATKDASWLLADFRVPDAGWRRRRALLIHRLMYFFFGLATRLPARRLVSPEGPLRANQFILCERQVSEWGLLHTDRWCREETSLATEDGARTPKPL